MSRRVNVLLLLLVAICGFSLWQARSGDRSGAPEIDRSALGKAGSGPVAEPVPDWQRPSVSTGPHLVVLNGTPKAGLARAVSLALGGGGCVIERVGNAPHDRFQETLLVNRKLPAGQAEELGKLLGGVTVIEEIDPRASEDALLVLGGDWHTVCQALGMPWGEDANGRSER
jgi:hypothetical protein